MQLPEFKSIDQPNYKIWTDCGTQFRSAEFIHFLFKELSTKRRLENNKAFSKSTARMFNPPQKTRVDITRRFREIEDLKSYYNFQNIRDKEGKMRFFSSVYSDRETLIPVNASDSPPMPDKFTYKAATSHDNVVKETTNAENYSKILKNLTSKHNKSREI